MAPLEVTSEIFIGFVATLLTVTTALILWYAAEKISPNEVNQLQFFLVFIVVVIPFLMLVYFGLDAILDDTIATRAGWSPELPLRVPPELPFLAVVYIVLAVWLGLRWRNLRGIRSEVN